MIQSSPLYLITNNNNQKTIKPFYWIVIGSVLLIAAAFRFYFLSNTNRILSRDSIHYINFAVQWYLDGSYYHASINSVERLYYPPLLLGLMKFFAPSPEYCLTIGTALNIFCGICFCGLLSHIGWLLLHRMGFAFLTGMLAATNPYLVELSIQVQRDMLYLFFYAAVVSIWLKYNISIGWSIVCGILSGLAFLSRYEGAELVLGFIILLFLNKIITKRSLDSFLTKTLLFSAVFLFTIVLFSIAFEIPFTLYLNQLKKIYLLRT